MAADETEQPGVLGNLPRSRPGQRSEKRTGAVRAAAASGAAPASAKPRPRSSAAPKRRPPHVAEPQAVETSPDPITAAVRAAGKVAEVGLRTAGSILRRLPGR